MPHATKYYPVPCTGKDQERVERMARQQLRKNYNRDRRVIVAAITKHHQDRWDDLLKLDIEARERGFVPPDFDVGKITNAQRKAAK